MVSGFISLSIMLSRNICVVANGKISLFAYGCPCQYTFYLSTKGHIGCFCILATVNNAEGNLGVQVSFWATVFVFFR